MAPQLDIYCCIKQKSQPYYQCKKYVATTTGEQMINNIHEDDVQYVVIVPLCPYVPERCVPFFLRWKIATHVLSVQIAT